MFSNTGCNAQFHSPLLSLWNKKNLIWAGVVVHIFIPSGLRLACCTQKVPSQGDIVRPCLKKQERRKATHVVGRPLVRFQLFSSSDPK